MTLINVVYCVLGVMWFGLILLIVLPLRRTLGTSPITLLRDYIDRAEWVGYVPMLCNMQRGAFPVAVMTTTTDNPLSEDEVARLKAEFEKCSTGPGKLFVSPPGTKVSYCQEWILRTERMPDKYQRVLFWMPDYHDYSPYDGFWDGSSFYDYLTRKNYNPLCVTHWKKLTSPP